MDIYKYEFSDSEIELKGYVMANDEEDAIKKARKACCINDTRIEEDVEVEFFMKRSDLEELLITGQCQTFYDDMG